jgi:hypothetical protein
MSLLSQWALAIIILIILLVARSYFKNKNKKAQISIGWIVLIAMFVLFLLGGVILILIVFNDKATNNPSLSSNLSIYISAIDNQTNIQKSGTYDVIFNHTLISSGKLDSNTLSEVKNINTNGIEVYCHSEGYYLSWLQKNFTQVEIENNASKITCKLNSYGNLKIETNSDIQREEGKIILQVSSKRKFNNISGVISWSSGIISVRYKIDSGVIPDRFKGKVDYYFETNEFLDNSNITLVFDYKTIPSKIPEDYIEITLFDKESYLLNGFLLQSSEYNGANLGNPEDFSVKIKYG